MIALSASKSDGLRVYRGRLLAAAVEAMSKSASRERLDCPAARAAANIRPYMRDASPSKGNGSHVVLAHCNRSWRRARSSLSSVACGPAANSARVMVEIAASSGSDAGSITSWSITTDVSRSPLDSSVIDVLIYHRIEIGTKPTGIDPGRANGSFGDSCSGHESARPDGPQFRDGRAIASHHDRSARLDLAKHGCRLIAQLALRDLAVHGVNVALVALRSNNHYRLNGQRSRVAGGRLSRRMAEIYDRCLVLVLSLDSDFLSIVATDAKPFQCRGRTRFSVEYPH